MPQLTIVIGILLIVLGPVGALISGTTSMTAYIPSIIGAIFLGLGLLALKDSARKLAMHIVMVVALLAILGSIGRAGKGWLTLLQGGDVELPVALAAQTITIVAALVLLIFGVKSFIDARRAQKETAAAPATAASSE